MAASEAIPDVSGKVLNGEYELLSALPGETRAVYEAQRKSDGQKVAVRLLRGLGPAAATVASERARRAVTVRHPALASVLDHGTSEDGTLFVVSEFVDGTPLNEWADAVGIPPLHKVVDFVHQLCLALQVARRHGLTHEFISPRNILVLPFTLGPQGRVGGKLLDLGITSASRQVTPAVESALFMAPEQLSELQLGTATGKQASPAANVYSAGALLYHLCTGGPPFRAGSLRALASAQAEQPLVRPSRINPAIPAPLDEIILRALSLDPSNRYPSVAELGEALAFIVARTQSVNPGSPSSVPASVAPDEPDTHQVPIPRSSRTPEGPSWMEADAPLPEMDSHRTARQRPLSDSSASQVLRSPISRRPGGRLSKTPSQAPLGLFSSGPPAPTRSAESGPPSDIRDTLPPPPGVPDAGDMEDARRTFDAPDTAESDEARRTFDAPDAGEVDDARKTLSTPPPAKYGPERPGSYRAAGMQDTVPPPGGSVPPGRPQSVRPTGSLVSPGPVRRRRSNAPPKPQASSRPIPPPLGQPASSKNPPSARVGARPHTHRQPPPATPEQEAVVGEAVEDHSAQPTPPAGSSLERIKLDVIMAEMDDEAGNEEATAPPGTFDAPTDPAAYAPYIPMPDQKPPGLLQRAQVALLALLFLGALGGAYLLLRADAPQTAVAPAGPETTPTALATAPAAPVPTAMPAAAPGVSAAGQQDEAASPKPSTSAPPEEVTAARSAAASRVPAPTKRRVVKRSYVRPRAAPKPAAKPAVAKAPRIETPPKPAPLPPKKAAPGTGTDTGTDAADGRDEQQVAKAAALPAPQAAPTAPPGEPVQKVASAPAPRTPAAPPAPLKARTSIVDLSVRGSLATSVVKRAVDRARDDFAACYTKAAKAAGKNGYGSVAVDFDVDFRGRTRDVRASGGSLPGLATCVRKAANTIATNRAPDTGTVHASFKVRYAP